MIIYDHSPVYLSMQMLPLPFPFSAIAREDPLYKGGTAYREAAVISKVVHENKLCRTALLILPSSKN